MIEFEQSPSFVFTGHDRRCLVTALARANDVKLFRRLQAVLQVVEGRSVREAAHFAGVDRSTVHRWLQTYQQCRRPEDLHEEARPGRPREADDLDEELLAEVLAQDPRTLGYRATGWTAPLLTTHLNQECGCAVSERTLRRRLEQYGWCWKRLRYVYGQRELHIGQKKGAFVGV